MDVIIDSYAWASKAALTEEQLTKLRAHLTVTPSVYEGEPKPILLYRENDQFFGMPRQYYLDRQRPTHRVEYRVTDGDKSAWPGDLAFTKAKSLREEQRLALRTIATAFRGNTLGGLLRAPPGWGKCLALGTPVLRYDGGIVPVEEIREGDLLMGPDSQPRRVTSTTRGRGPLYRIVPKIGRPWVCNDAHILTLVHSETNLVTDIALQDWLRLPAWKKHHLKQFAPPTGVDFPKAARLPLDPYFVGVWFGDGTKRLSKVAITTKDPEIEQLCRDMAAQYGLAVRQEIPVHLDNPCPTYHIVVPRGSGENPLLDDLRAVVGDAERLPAAYLRASREDRRKFLAGLIDTDGHHNNGCYELIQKRRAWSEDVAFLARSLGIRATVKPKQVAGSTYWMVKMAGDFVDVPMRLPRKVPRPRLQKKVATRTSFEVESIGEGDYAGFTLEGDGRFLLGDFTVTHNTVFACGLIAELNVPTLVVVHKAFLMDQWAERLTEYLPGVQLGVAQESRCEFQGKHVVLGMVHSLGGAVYPNAFYRWPGLVISDEVHRIGALTWSGVPGRFTARRRLGITATPRRKDGAEAVFQQHIGPELFAAREESLPFAVRFVTTDFYVVKGTTYNTGLSSRTTIVSFLCASEPRNRQIVGQILMALAKDRKCLVVSERLEHLAALERTLRAMAPEGHCPSIGYYVGGMRRDAREESERCQVILATVQNVQEGLDIPPLDTLFLTTPLGDIEQMVGRIRRVSPGKKPPVVVDFRDDRVPMFKRQAAEREAFYRKAGALK